MDRPASRRVELSATPAGVGRVVRRIDVEISWTPRALRLRYFVDCDVSRIACRRRGAASGGWPVAPHLLRGVHRRRDVHGLLRVQLLAVHRVAVYGFTSYARAWRSSSTHSRPQVTASVTDDRIALEAIVPRESLLALPGDSMLRSGSPL